MSKQLEKQRLRIRRRRQILWDRQRFVYERLIAQGYNEGYFRSAVEWADLLPVSGLSRRCRIHIAQRVFKAH